MQKYLSIVFNLYQTIHFSSFFFSNVFHNSALAISKTYLFLVIEANVSVLYRPYGKGASTLQDVFMEGTQLIKIKVSRGS